MWFSWLKLLSVCVHCVARFNHICLQVCITLVCVRQTEWAVAASFFCFLPMSAEPLLSTSYTAVRTESAGHVEGSRAAVIVWTRSNDSFCCCWCSTPKVSSGLLQKYFRAFGLKLFCARQQESHDYIIVLLHHHAQQPGYVH